MKLSKFAAETLESKYKKECDKDVQDVFIRAAYAFADNEDHANRIKTYIKNRWFCPSTPILANAPKRISFGKDFHDNFTFDKFDKKYVGRQMPISCFLSYVDDTVEGLIEHTSEIRFLSIIGGGCAGHWSDIRANVEGGKSPGPIPFIKTIDSDVLAYHQAGTRRGSYAAYLNISHPSIEEFINGRLPTGGDINRKFINIHYGVNLTDEFLECVKLDKDFNLVCPHTKKVIKTINARRLWYTLLEVRHKTGEPYLIHIDEMNRLMPIQLKNKGYRINGSNLCTEITLPTDKNRTGVCCLSSLNVEFFDEWQHNSDIVEDCIRYLDNVLEYFIRYGSAYSYLSKAVLSAEKERSIGLGTMGLHNFFMKNKIPFDSVLARAFNNKIYKTIYQRAIKASKQLAIERGEPEDMVGSGRRNAHVLAIAPNANTSIFLGASPSIEPLRANFYHHKTSSGINLIKNRYLIDYLKNDLGWSDTKINKLIKNSIINNGSVQQEEDLPKEAKEIFKTAVEIDQHVLVILAADRQNYIDQAQSLNLFFPAEVKMSYLNSVHWDAMYKYKLKSLYYLRSEPIDKAKVDELFLENNGKECSFCES